MDVRTIGIVMNGVTGRMGTNQHLDRSIMAIRNEGGIRVNDDLTLMPDPILTGRNEAKLKALCERFGLEKYTTDVEAAIQDDSCDIVFDASGTQLRAKFVEMAAKAKKPVYCEKPTAVDTATALDLAKTCETAGIKNGVVQDKLWLPGLWKLKDLIDQGYFGRILSVRGEFGYWVNEGTVPGQAPQRPSWNYRKEDGGGMMLDMLCHWRYVIDNIFGDIKAMTVFGATHIPERVDENGKTYQCTADDSAYATFELKSGVVIQFNMSWCTRPRRDDLLTLHVDGTEASAVATLRDCRILHRAGTPKPVWNPDIPQPINFFDCWQMMPTQRLYDNAFKIQWELFIRHVVLDEPFRWTLREGAKGVQLAELGLQSWAERRWLDVPEL